MASSSSPLNCLNHDEKVVKTRHMCFCTQHTYFAHNSHILRSTLFFALVNKKLFLELNVDAANVRFPLV